jgi:hypothetical protein
MLARRIGAQHRNRTCYFRGTNSAHRQQCLRGLIGANPGMCALHLFLTKELHRYLCLVGKLESTTGVEPAQRGFGGHMLKSVSVDKLDPSIGVEPTRFAFVARSPNSLGPTGYWSSTLVSNQAVAASPAALPSL